MRLHEQISYQAPVDEVFTMLCTQRFREQVCERTGALRYEVSVAAVGPTATIRVSRAVPADVPDLIKRFVGDEIEIVSTEIWTAPDAAANRTADLLIEIPGKPAQMRGSIRIEPVGAATVESVDGDISVNVPFVGGRIEGEIAKAIRAAIAEEADVGAAWLAG
jgi:hypothetical protein